GIRQLRPRVAPIRGLVNPDAGFASGGAPVPLARTDVERVPARIVGIGDESANGVKSQDASKPRPTRVCRQGVVRPPNAAAGGADPETAVTRYARWSNDQRRVTARRRCRRPRERQHTGLDGVLTRTVRLPMVVAPRVALGGDPVKSVLCV